MSKDLLQRLYDQRRTAIAEQRTLIDLVDADKRDFTAEETEKLQKMNDDIDGLGERVAQLMKVAEKAKESDEFEERMKSLVGDPEKRDETGTKDPADELENQFRQLARGERRSVDIVPGKLPNEFRAIAELSKRQREQRDLLEGTPTAGGNTVPTTFYGRLIEHLIEVSGVLSANPTTLRTTSGETIQVPKTTAFSTAALTAEGVAITESDPAFGQTPLTAYKYATLIQVSSELIDDTAVDLLGFIAKQAGRAVGNAIGAHLVTGTGTSQPQGVVTGSTLGVTSATGVVGAPNSADQLIDLYYSVISPYRNSPDAAWLMRDATVATIRKLKDTTNQYIWTPGLQIGAPDTILGKPVITDPFVAATALNARSIAFGDFSAYFVRLVNGIQFDRSDEFAFNTDLVTFRVKLRGDGRLVDATGAIKHFVGAAT